MAGGILVVADHPDDRYRLEQIIRDAGYGVRRGCTSARAFGTAVKDLPELVLLDASMDDMDGFRICRKLSTDARTRGVVIIMICEGDRRMDSLWVEQQGVAGLITKPYSDEQVLEQVRRFL